MQHCDTKTRENVSPVPSDRSMSTTIAHELAAVMGIDPVEMTPLADSVDTDALDALFGTAATDAQFQFTHEGYRVLVTPTGIAIRPPNLD